MSIEKQKNNVLRFEQKARFHYLKYQKLADRGNYIDALVALRAAAGTAGIYCLDLLFTALGIGLHAGINLFNMLVVGVLGLPGIGLLYAVLAIKTL